MLQKEFFQTVSIQQAGIPRVHRTTGDVRRQWGVCATAPSPTLRQWRGCICWWAGLLPPPPWDTWERARPSVWTAKPTCRSTWISPARDLQECATWGALRSTRLTTTALTLKWQILTLMLLIVAGSLSNDWIFLLCLYLKVRTAFVAPSEIHHNEEYCKILYCVNFICLWFNIVLMLAVIGFHTVCLLSSCRFLADSNHLPGTDIKASH